MKSIRLNILSVLLVLSICPTIAAQDELNIYLASRFEYLGESYVKSKTTRDPIYRPEQNRSEFDTKITKYRFLIVLNIQTSGRELLPNDYFVLKYKYFDGKEGEISFSVENLIQISPDKYEYSFEVLKEFEGTMEMYLQHKNRFSKKVKIKSESNKISLYLSR